MIGRRDEGHAWGSDVSAWPLCPRPVHVSRREGPAFAMVVAWVHARELHGALRTPEELPRLTGGSVSTSIAGAWCGAGARSRQGYHLRVDGHRGVAIESATTAGLRHGVATLLQLLRVAPRDDHGRSLLPACDIHDEPAIETRGVMLDISRDRIPRMDELLALPAMLASLKVNHVQLYVEHTLAYAGHEEAWRGSSALTLDELQRFRDACAEVGIALGANQNCFGHLSHWLRKPRYAHLAETHGPWMFDVWPREGPFSLCPGDPGSIALVRDLLSQQCRALWGAGPGMAGAASEGAVCNIGCDEVYDIAHGRSAQQVRARGRLAVYSEFVDQVARAAREHGARPALWADIVLHGGDERSDDTTARAQREALAMLRSHDALALIWGYEPDAPFREHVARTRAAGLDAWVCPGTSCWRSLTGRTQERRANLDAAARAGTLASGMLTCVWGDLGHWQQWSVTLHALGQAAGAMWSGAIDADGTSHGPHVFAGLECARAMRLAELLDELGDADEPLRRIAGPLAHPNAHRLRNATALFASLHAPRDRIIACGHADAWQHALITLGRLSERASCVLRDGSLLADEVRWTIDIAMLAARRSLSILRSDGFVSAASHDATRDGFARSRIEFARLWLARSRVGGLAESMSRFDHLAGPASPLESMP